jgi:iron complex transport system ATP-binding protein
MTDTTRVRAWRAQAQDPPRTDRRDGDAVLRTRALTVGYQGRGDAQRVVLSDLDLKLRAGELTCLLGPNGSGKSTLLRTAAGMQPALAGHAELAGDVVSSLSTLDRARRMAVVLTDQVDVGIMRATDLVALGRYPHTGWSGRLRAADRQTVRWALDACGATSLATRTVAELSDGERQRVLIARALAQQPQVLALDEPIAFIDVPRRVELTALLRDLARECGLAILMTTHDLDLAIRTADEVWLIEPGEPGALHVGAPEDLVLSGAIGRAFHSVDVTFDLMKGGFVSRSAPLARARVDGHGPGAVWARRALEREGLTLAASGDPDVVVWVVDGPQASDGPQLADGLRWRLSSGDHVSEHRRLGDLASTVRGLLPQLAGRRDRI